MEKVIQCLKNLIKDTEYENHVYIIGGCLRDQTIINDVDIVLDIEDYIGFCKYMTEKTKCRSLYNPFVEKSKHTAMFSFFSIPELSDIRFDVKMARKNKEYELGTMEENFYTNMDFTCNSLWYNVTTDELTDYSGKAVEDIKDKILRQNHPGIFEFSPIRIYRAARFLSYGYTIEEETLQNLRNSLHLDIPKDHLDYEMNKINSLVDNSKTLQFLEKLRGGNI